MRYADTKNQILNLRMPPFFNQTLKESADYGQLSMVNMFEALLGEYCDRKDVALTPQKEPAAPGHKRICAVSIAVAGVAV